MKYPKGTLVRTPGPSRAEGGDVGWAEWTIVGPGPVRNRRRLYRLAPENDAAKLLLTVLRSGDVPVRGRLNEDGEYLATAQYMLPVERGVGGRA